MEFRWVRTSGLKVSEVGLGCNNFGMRLDQDGTTAVVHAAIDAGVTFFDTADVYGGSKSETMLGEALKVKRHEVVLATKVGMQVGAQVELGPAARAVHVVEGVDAGRPPADRPHRPLSAAPARSGDGHRRDAWARWTTSSAPARSATSKLQPSPAGRSRRPTGSPRPGTWSRFRPRRRCSTCWAAGGVRGAAGLRPFRAGVSLPFSTLASRPPRASPMSPRGPKRRRRGPAWPVRAGVAPLNRQNFDRLEKLSAFAEGHGRNLRDHGPSRQPAQAIRRSRPSSPAPPSQEQVQANAGAAGWKLRAPTRSRKWPKLVKSRPLHREGEGQSEANGRGRGYGLSDLS